MSRFKNFLEQKGRKFFFLLQTIQMFLLLVFVLTDILVNIKDSQNISSKEDDIYKWVILLIFSFSQYYYAWNAILRANVMELFAFTSIATATTIACIVRMYEVTGILVLQIFNWIYLGYIIGMLGLTYASYIPFYDIFLYRNIMKVGASIESQKIFRNYSYFFALIKLYTQFSFCVYVTFFFYFDKNWVLYLIDGLAMFITVIAIFLAYRGIIRENQLSIQIYAGLITFIQCYLLGKLLYFMIIMIENKNSNTFKVDIYTQLVIISTFIASTLIMILNFYFGLQCIEGFGNGMNAMMKSQSYSVD